MINRITPLWAIHDIIVDSIWTKNKNRIKRHIKKDCASKIEYDVDVIMRIIQIFLKGSIKENM